MTSIQGHGRLCREHISKSLLRSSSPPEFSHDKALVDPAAISPSKSPVAKYTEKDLERICRMILEVQAPPFDKPREKLLKAKSSDVYCGKSHIECYNFC